MTLKFLGLVSLLTITFVVLKCLGYIDWSWWLVFSPLWGSFILAVILCVVVLVFGLSALCLPDIADWLADHFYFKL